MLRWQQFAGVGIVLALGACGASSDSTTPSVLDGPVIRYPESSSNDDGMDAEVRGRLELDGGCLFVVVDEIAERYPVVWPAGTSWDAKQEAVVAPSTARMPVGDEVDGGGGYLFVEDVERLIGSEAATVAERCVDNADDEIVFVNNQEDGIGPA
jgi:hypothetical protein